MTRHLFTILSALSLLLTYGRGVWPPTLISYP
jgi:hypothetical protein